MLGKILCEVNYSIEQYRRDSLGSFVYKTGFVRPFVASDPRLTGAAVAP